MDISKEFIEMCKKAQEIQDLKKHYYVGDVVLGNDTIKTIVDHDLNEGCNTYKTIYVEDGDTIKEWLRDFNLKVLVWLPRQDQLQKLMLKRGAGMNSPHWIQPTFNSFCHDDYNGRIICTSYEQLWLCFVMKEKFRKVWSVKDQNWIIC